MSLPHSIHVVTHPLVQHKLTKLRDKETSSTNFRRLLREIGLLLGYDATRDLPTVQTRIETPIEAMEAPLLDGKKLVVVRFHGGRDNRPDLQVIEGNVGSVQKLYGNLAAASPNQRPTVTWIEQFIVTPKDPSKPLVFRLTARDKRGASSRVWNEDR